MHGNASSAKELQAILAKLRQQPHNMFKRARDLWLALWKSS